MTKLIVETIKTAYGYKGRVKIVDSLGHYYINSKIERLNREEAREDTKRIVENTKEINKI